jgi:hypothetical protein
MDFDPRPFRTNGQMRKVADSNILQTPALAAYLAQPGNKVVLPDYVSMEAYKGDTLISIQKSMSVLSRFPRQVIVLKGTQVICGMRGRTAGLQRRMIDNEQSGGFPRFCADLKAAKNGDAAYVARLLRLGRSASTHMNHVSRDAETLAHNFRKIQNIYSNEEIRRLRRKEPLTRDFYEKLQTNILQTAAFMFVDHPKVNKLPSAVEVRNTLIFRFALCMQLLILHWISEGSEMNLRSEKFANDKVDMMIAAYGTFFDGILSHDKKLLTVYERAIAVLDELSAP